MPELERLMLHRLAELDGDRCGEAYRTFDYKRVVALLNAFMTTRPVGLLFRHPQGHALLRSDLVGKVRKSRAHRDRPSFRCVVTWLAPILRLHRGGSVARALPARTRSPCIWKPSREVPRRMARR